MRLATFSRLSLGSALMCFLLLAPLVQAGSPVEAVSSPVTQVLENPGCYIPSLHLFKSALYYLSACEGTNTESRRVTLFRSNGTLVGTMPVVSWTDSNLAGLPLTSIQTEAQLFFWLGIGSNIELWGSDGTAAGTTMLVRFPYWVRFTHHAIGNTLYVAIHGIDTNVKPHAQLWKSDGTNAGTVLIKDLQVPAISPQQVATLSVTDTRFSFVGGLGSRGTTLYFVLAEEYTEPGSAHYALWRSDGIAESTVLVKSHVLLSNIFPSIIFHAFHGLLYFRGAGFDQQLWQTDGTAGGTVLARFLPSQSPVGALQSLGSDLFFQYGDIGLWRTDGITSCTIQLTHQQAARVGTQAPGRHMLMFEVVDNLSLGRDLWRSDGTVAGTIPLTSIQRTYPWSFPVDEGKLYTHIADDVFLVFVKTALNGNYSIYRVDATTMGAIPLQTDLNVIPAGSPVIFGDSVYFSAHNTVGTASLWKIPLANLQPDPAAALSSAVVRSGVPAGHQTFIPRVASPC